MDINPELKLTRVQEFFPERAWNRWWRIWLCFRLYDSITPKLNLIIAAKRKKIKGMGLEVKWKSKVKVSIHCNCFFAKTIRRRLKVKIDKLKVVGNSRWCQFKMTDGSNYKRSLRKPGLFGLYAAEKTVIRYLKKE
jgi:hypothetical protein